MTKFVIWLITLAGVAVPMVLSVSWLSTVSRFSIPARYAERRELGGDPKLHDSYFYVEIFGQRHGLNSSIYPPLIMMAGVVLIILGMFLALHVNTGVTWAGGDSN